MLGLDILNPPGGVREGCLCPPEKSSQIPAPWERWVSKGRDRKLDCLREISYHFPKCCYPVQQTLKSIMMLGQQNCHTLSVSESWKILIDQHHILLMIMNSPRNLVVRVCLHNKTCRIVFFIAAFFFFFFFFNMYIYYSTHQTFKTGEDSQSSHFHCVTRCNLSTEFRSEALPCIARYLEKIGICLCGARFKNAKSCRCSGALKEQNYNFIIQSWRAFAKWIGLGVGLHIAKERKGVVI